MSKISITLRIFVFLALLQISALISIAQVATETGTLINDTVIELVKSGIPESIILAKIKKSNTNFDTSSTSLVKLKESGVSENIILAMVEAEPNITEGSKEENKTDALKTAEMTEAVGKRKIFILTEDEESRLEIMKRFTKKGFTFVNSKELAELIFELSYAEGTTQQKAGIFKGGNETAFKTKIGKLVVKLYRNSEEYLIYAREYNYAKAANMASLFGVSATPPPLRDQVKYYFVDDFLKQMKKGGDKF